MCSIDIRVPGVLPGAANQRLSRSTRVLGYWRCRGRELAAGNTERITTTCDKKFPNHLAKSFDPQLWLYSRISFHETVCHGSDADFENRDSGERLHCPAACTARDAFVAEGYYTLRLRSSECAQSTDRGYIEGNFRGECTD